MRFLRGFIFAFALLAGAAIAAVYTGIVPSSADNKPSFVEHWLARTALKAAIARETKGLSSPVQPTDENLTAAVKLYGENCAMCHGTSDGEPSRIARGFNVKSPQLAKDGVEDDPVEVSYWKIKHGIRFTAMPSFDAALPDEQIWQLATLVSKMDKLPPGALAAWKALPSSAGSPSAVVSPSASESAPAAAAAPGALVPRAAESPRAPETPEP